MVGNDSAPATRADLAAVRRDLSLEIVRVQSDVREIKDVMATKDDVKRILDGVGAFAGKSQNYDRASTLHGQAPTDVQVQMKDHESRIKTLESRSTGDSSR